MIVRNPDLSDAKPRVIRYERKRLALLGNQRALKHGRTTAAAKRARLEAQKAFQEAGAKAHAEWLASLAPILQACDAQQARILAELERERAERAKTESDLWGPIWI